jgi:predicted permease
VLPAKRVLSADPGDALRAGGRGLTRSTQRLNGAFVIAQLALAIVLLAAAGSLARTLLTLTARDPGIRPAHVVAARVALAPEALDAAGRIQTAWADVLDRARGVAGVESAALTDIVPMRAGTNTLPYSTTARLKPSNELPIALASTVTPDYFTAMGIALRAGRFFDGHDRLDGEPVIVVDETLATRAFGRTDVVGRQLWVPAMGPAPLRIIGVAGHVRHWGLAADDQSNVRDQLYYPFAQVPPRLLRLFSTFMSIVVKARVPPAAIMDDLQTALRSGPADHVLYEIRTMEQLVGSSLSRQRFLAVLFAMFGGAAMLLACTGIYGLLAYLTTQRSREFSLRMALGASSRDVIQLVLHQSLRLMGAGMALGAGGAWACGRLIQHVVPGAQPLEPVTLLIMTGLLVAAALMASYIPARRAGRTDAARALASR